MQELQGLTRQQRVELLAQRENLTPEEFMRKYDLGVGEGSMTERLDQGAKQWAGVEGGWWSSAAAGAGEALTDPENIPLVGTAVTVYNAHELYDAASTKSQDRTPQQHDLLQAYYIDQAKESVRAGSSGYTAGQIFGQGLTFSVDFALTAGAAGLARAGATKVTKGALKEVLKKASKEYIEESVTRRLGGGVAAKVAGKTAGLGAQAVGHTAVREGIGVGAAVAVAPEDQIDWMAGGWVGQKTWEAARANSQLIQAYDPSGGLTSFITGHQEEFIEALPQGIAEALIMRGAEAGLGPLSGMTKAAGAGAKAVIKQVPGLRALATANFGGMAQTLGKAIGVKPERVARAMMIAQKGGGQQAVKNMLIGGPIEEYMEERDEELLNAIVRQLTGDPRERDRAMGDLFTASMVTSDTWFEELAAFSMMGASRGAAGAGINYAQYAVSPTAEDPVIRELSGAGERIAATPEVEQRLMDLTGGALSRSDQMVQEAGFDPVTGEPLTEDAQGRQTPPRPQPAENMEQLKAKAQAQVKRQSDEDIEFVDIDALADEEEGVAGAREVRDYLRENYGVEAVFFRGSESVRGMPMGRGAVAMNLDLAASSVVESRRVGAHEATHVMNDEVKGHLDRMVGAITQSDPEGVQAISRDYWIRRGLSSGALKQTDEGVAVADEGKWAELQEAARQIGADEATGNYVEKTLGVIEYLSDEKNQGQINQLLAGDTGFVNSVVGYLTDVLRKLRFAPTRRAEIIDQIRDAAAVDGQRDEGITQAQVSASYDLAGVIQEGAAAIKESLAFQGMAPLTRAEEEELAEAGAEFDEPFEEEAAWADFDMEESPVEQVTRKQERATRAAARRRDIPTAAEQAQEDYLDDEYGDLFSIGEPYRFPFPASSEAVSEEDLKATVSPQRVGQEREGVPGRSDVAQRFAREYSWITRKEREREERRQQRRKGAALRGEPVERQRPGGIDDLPEATRAEQELYSYRKGEEALRSLPLQEWAKDTLVPGIVYSNAALPGELSEVDPLQLGEVFSSRYSPEEQREARPSLLRLVYPKAFTAEEWQAFAADSRNPSEMRSKLVQAGHDGARIRDGRREVYVALFPEGAVRQAKLPAEEVAQLNAAGAVMARFSLGTVNKELAPELRKGLTDKEKEQFFVSRLQKGGKVGKDFRNALDRVMEELGNLPSVSAFKAAAIAGRAKKGWYRRSAQGLLNVFGITEEAVGRKDAVRFAQLLAALSPQTSVEWNLRNSASVWRAWIESGRTTDVAELEQIIEDNVKKSEAKKGEGGKSAMEAWVSNAVQALAAEDPSTVVLSGPKVDSFWQNLVDNTVEVTNDTWMARFANREQAMFGGVNATLPQMEAPGMARTRTPGSRPGLKGAGYIAMNARVRRTARELEKETGEEWTPENIQETIWSFAKTVVEMAEAAGTTVADIVFGNQFSHEDIAGTVDFSMLLEQDEYVRDHLVRAGLDPSVGAVEQPSLPEGAPEIRRALRGPVRGLDEQLANKRFWTEKIEVQLNLTAATESIPEIKSLLERSAAGDKAAQEAIEQISSEHLQHLLSTYSGLKVETTPVIGVFDGAYEPAIQAVVKGTRGSIADALPALAEFGTLYNQWEVHQLEELPARVKPGKRFKDGGFATTMFEWELTSPMTVEEIEAIRSGSGLIALNQNGNRLTAYYAEDPTDQESINAFKQQTQEADKLLGANGRRARRMVRKTIRLLRLAKDEIAGEQQVGYSQVAPLVKAGRGKVRSPQKALADAKKGKKKIPAKPNYKAIAGRVSAALESDPARLSVGEPEQLPRRVEAAAPGIGALRDALMFTEGYDLLDPEDTPVIARLIQRRYGGDILKSSTFIPEPTEGLLESPDFRQQFGQSKIVDEAGQPQVMYHGTTESFQRFRSSPSGIWFAYEAHQATPGEGDGEGILKTAYLRAENPYTMTPQEKDSFLASETPLRDIAKLRKQDRMLNHDAVIVPGYAVVVFKNDQIIPASEAEGSFQKDHYWNRLPDGTQVDLSSEMRGGNGYEPVSTGGAARVAAANDSDLRLAEQEAQMLDERIDDSAAADAPRLSVEEGGELLMEPEQRTPRIIRRRDLAEGFSPLTPGTSMGGRSEGRLQAMQLLVDSKIYVRELVERFGKPGEVGDFDRAERLRRSRARARVERLRDTYVRPLARMASNQALRVQATIGEEEYNESGVGAVGLYLMARHARHYHGAKQELYRADLEDMGFTDEEVEDILREKRLAGMSLMEAREILSQVENGEQAEQFKEIGQLFDSMHQDGLREAVRARLITQEDAARMTEAYPHYAPLRDPEAEPMTSFGAAMARADGVQMKRSLFKTGLGRSTLADPGGVLSRAFSQQEMRVGAIESERVRQELLVSAEKWEEELGDDSPIAVEPIIATLRASGGRVITVKEQVREFAGSNNVIAVMQADGTAKKLVFDPSWAPAVEALKGGGASQAAVARVLGWWLATTNAWKGAVTRFSPRFLLRNSVRDPLDVSLKLQELGPGASARAMSLLTGGYQNADGRRQGLRRALYDYQQGKLDPNSSRLAQYVNDYYADGANVTVFDLKGEAQQRAELDRMVKRARAGKDPEAVNLVRQAMQWLDSWNEAVENSARLASYIVYRERYESQQGDQVRDNAALFAKEVTTNFEQKGSLGMLMEAVLPFSTAQMTGNQRLLQNMQRTGPKTAMAVAALAFTSAALQRALAGEDDDDENMWDSAPDYEKHTNLILMSPTGERLLLPIPYGYQIATGAGTLAADTLFGDLTASEAFSQVAGLSFATAVPDWKQLGGPLLTIPRQLTSNYDYFRGRSIAPSPMPGDVRPASERAWPNESAFWKGSSQVANAVTGGSQQREGLVSVEPAKLRFAYEQITGGAGQFLANAMDLVTGQASELGDLPIAGSMLRERSEHLSGLRMRERVRELKILEAEYEDGDSDLRAEVRQNPLFRARASLTRLADKANEQRKKAQEYKAAGREERAERATEQYQKLASQFNRKWKAAAE